MKTPQSTEGGRDKHDHSVTLRCVCMIHGGYVFPGPSYCSWIGTVTHVIQIAVLNKRGHVCPQSLQVLLNSYYTPCTTFHIIPSVHRHSPLRGRRLIVWIK